MKGTRVLAIGTALSIAIVAFTTTPGYAQTGGQQSYSESYGWEGGRSQGEIGGQTYERGFDGQSYGRRFDDQTYREQPYGQWDYSREPYGRQGYDRQQPGGSTRQWQYGREQYEQPYGRQYDRQPPFSGSRSERESMYGQSQGRAGMQQSMQLSGRITEMTPVRLNGRQYVFARIRTQDGGTYVANLGPAGQVDRLHLYPGDMAQIRGTGARVNDRPVIMALEVRANDQSIRNEPMRAGGTRRPAGRGGESQQGPTEV